MPAAGCRRVREACSRAGAILFALDPAPARQCTPLSRKIQCWGGSSRGPWRQLRSVLTRSTVRCERRIRAVDHRGGVLFHAGAHASRRSNLRASAACSEGQQFEGGRRPSQEAAFPAARRRCARFIRARCPLGVRLWDVLADAGGTKVSDLQALTKRLMGLEPTTFCMASSGESSDLR